MLAFESYRDLVHLLQKGYSEEDGLEAAERQNVAERAKTMAAAAAAVAASQGQAAGPIAPGAAALTPSGGGKHPELCCRSLLLAT